jgi:YfiH family protein
MKSTQETTNFAAAMEITSQSFIKPVVFDGVPDLVAAQSTRHGGVSQAPFDTLNLGKSTEDDPSGVQENRRIFCHQLGYSPEQMAWSKQVHGDGIRIVDSPGGSEGHDALVTDVPRILLAVSIADCTPVLICDPVKRVIAAVHAGWKGTVAGLAAKTLMKMQECYGTNFADCRVFIGACIDECSFEVGNEVAVQFDDPFKRYDTDRRKYMIDLKKANAHQCLELGVPASRIEISPFSTFIHHEHFFSHRYDKGVTGRGLCVIALNR